MEKEINNDVKKPTSYSLADDSKKLLKLLSVKHKRSMAEELEFLIEQACASENITLPEKN